MNSPAKPSPGSYYERLMQARKEFCDKNGHVIFHARCKTCGQVHGGGEAPKYGRTIFQLREEAEAQEDKDNGFINVGAAA